MKFQGDIASIGAPDVAQNLASNRKTGILTLRLGETLRRLAFLDGKVVSYSDNLGFSVPAWLSMKGLVDPKALDSAAGKARKARKKDLGSYLEDAGALTRDDYLHHLKSLVLEMLYETFSFREGTFEFDEGELDPKALDPDVGAVGFAFPVGPILIEAARRCDDWEALRKCMPPENDFYRVPTGERAGRIAELEGDEIARAAIELLDGTRTIGEVIARIPASRFEGSRAIADLVGRKWARPVEGTEILGQLGTPRSADDKARALVQLKAALEREPGNRPLLRKVADLNLELGNKEESAVHRKLLAGGLLEDGDSAGAEAALRESLRLNPKDMATWGKLYDLLAERGDEAALYTFGSTMSRNLRKMGLVEVARDHLGRMIERFPAQPALRIEHADALYALGDRAGAADELFTLGRDLLRKGRYDEAERALAKALDVDRTHARAREIHGKLRSGKIARERARRKFAIRTAIAGALLAAMGLFIVYDLWVRREFVIASRQVYAEGLLERGEYAEAVRRLEEVGARHRVSLLRFLEGTEVETLREIARKKVDPVGPTPAPRPAPSPATPLQGASPLHSPRPQAKADPSASPQVPPATASAPAAMQSPKGGPGSKSQEPPPRSLKP